MAAFSVIGAGVFLGGLGLQALLVQVCAFTALTSYAVQAVASIEASFVLNRRFTWPDREVPFWLACWRFNVQKAALSVVNFLAYGLLVRFGMNYLVANVALTVVFTAINYVGGDRWSFALTRRASEAVVKPGAKHRLKPYAERGAALPASAEWLLLNPPTVSVVVPCKNNQRTIRATVEALLGQDYPGLKEVILVGSEADTTWDGLNGVWDPRLTILEQAPTPGKRDPNVKRDKGIRKATGDLLALADSDIVMEPGWLSAAVLLMHTEDVDYVAGGMRSIHNSFWGRFVDRNRLAAKTPRVAASYLVTRQNFGKRGRKPPITANALFTRDLYNAVPLDVTWAYGYEDYEWMWRVTRAGRFRVLYSDLLPGRHHHRRCLRDLITEYQRAAEGCAHFVRAHPDSPLARKRRRQAFMLPTLTVPLLGSAVAVVGAGRTMGLLAVVGAIALVMMASEMVSARRLEAAVYPYAGVALGAVFTWSLATNLAKGRFSTASDGTDRTLIPDVLWDAETSQRKSRPSWQGALAFAVIIAIALLLRLYRLNIWPEWDVDELAYTPIAETLLRYHTLALTPHGQLFLWHPPFYFLALSRWFGFYGTGITSARVLGVLASVPTFSLIAWWLYRNYNRATALFATILISFDGWMLYVQRISWIENLLVPLLLLTVVWYTRALERRSWNAYIICGLLAGITFIFNHDGVVILLVIMAHWILVRRDSWKHMALLACSGLVTATYVLVMIHRYPGVWWAQTYVQWLRITYRGGNHGSIRNPVQFAQLFLLHYWIFAPSVAVAFTGIAILCRLAYLCLRTRSLRPAGEDVFLATWAGVAVVVLGIAGIRYAQYFVLALIPLYMLVWVTAWRRLRLLNPKIIVACMGILVLLGMGSAFARFVNSKNAFASAAEYVQTHISNSSLVATSAPLVLSTPTCLEFENSCMNRAQYIFAWDNFTQALTVPPGVHVYRLASYKTFSGSLDIFKIGRISKTTATTVGVDVQADRNYTLAEARADAVTLAGYIGGTLHATALGLVWDYCDAHDNSDAVLRCTKTLSPLDAKAIADAAHADGLTVQFRPLVRVGPPSGWNDPHDSWEGFIKPAQQQPWFRSLFAAEQPYLKILSTIPGSQFVVGTELRGIQQSPLWRLYFKMAESTCHCQVSLSYSAGQFAIGHVVASGALGVDWYPSLHLPADASQAQVTRAWETSLASVPQSVRARTSLDEESIRATEGAYYHPQSWNASGPGDPAVQARYFTAACQTAAHYHMRAVYFYELPLNDNPAHPFAFPAYFVDNAGSRAIQQCRVILGGS